MGDVPPVPLRTRTFVADRLRFVIESSDRDTVTFMERLFADLLAPSEDTIVDDIVPFQVAPADGGGWRLAGPRIGRQQAPDLRSAVVHLLAAVNVTALDMSADRLHLHAAAAVRNGRAVVMAAKRNTGKTTTVAHLVTRPGWAFITDETVALDVDNGLICGTPRPLSVKPHGRARLDLLVDHMLPEPVVAGAHQFVPLGAAGVEVTSGAPPHLVVLLRRRGAANGVPSCTPLHGADAVVALMEETLDATRFGPNTVQVLAGLAGCARCIDLVVGAPPLTAEFIESQMELDTAPVSAIETHLPTGQIEPSVRSVTIDGRAVVHHTASGVVVALDERATDVWLALHDREASVDLRSPGVGPFVRQLKVLDLISDADS